MGNMFSNCYSLTNLDGISHWDTRSLKKAYGMFDTCKKLQELDLSAWSTENLEDMRIMFYDCVMLTKLDISSFTLYHVPYGGMGDVFYNLGKSVVNGPEIIVNDDTRARLDDRFPDNSTIKEHNHSWTFTASGNSITATCSNATNPCGFRTNGLTLTVDASACTKTYNGSQCESATVKQIGNWNLTGKSIPTIYYSGVKEDGTEYTQTDERPTDAGTYYATITIDNRTASSQFRITKATQTATISMSDYTYGTTPSNPSVIGASESPTITYYYNTENNNSNGTEWSSANHPLNVGDYYMYAVLDETANYNEYVTTTDKFTVINATLSSITVDSVTKTYDGNEHGITVNVPSDATIKYGTVYGTYNLDESPKFHDVSDVPYTVYYEITKPNYNVFRGSQTVTINKANVTVTPNEGLSKVYKESDPTLHLQ